MLIKIWNERIGDDDQANAVSARELYAFLGVKKDFTTWFKDQAFRLQLIEGKHFILLPEKGEQKGRGGHNRVDYLVLMEAAKRIAMMTGTSRGEEVRDYFLECERRAHSVSPSVGMDLSYLLANPAEMLRLIGGYCQQIVARDEVIAITAPKAEALDRISASEGSFCITDAAKHLNIKPCRLFDYLSANSWIFRRNGNTWKVYQTRVEQGVAEDKTTEITRSDGSTKTVSQARITAKGLAKLAELLRDQ